MNIAMTMNIPKSIPALNMPDTTPHELRNIEDSKKQKAINLFILTARSGL
jgi:hypothetical protein